MVVHVVSGGSPALSVSVVRQILGVALAVQLGLRVAWTLLEAH